MLRDEDLRVLQSVHAVLEAIRAELREEQRRGGETSTAVAVMSQKIKSIDLQIKSLTENVAKRSDRDIDDARIKGGDKVKWAIAGTLGGGAALYVLQLALERAIG